VDEEKELLGLSDILVFFVIPNVLGLTLYLSSFVIFFVCSRKNVNTLSVLECLCSSDMATPHNKVGGVSQGSRSMVS
jgi:hypothetical protein